MARYGSLPFAEQIRFFRQKDLIPTERWSDVWRDEHDAGFMVAGAASVDLLADLHRDVSRAINEGVTIRDFRRNFERTVARHGWTGWRGEGTPEGRAWRTRLIYETNLRTSYQAGRWAQVQAVKDRRPYIIYRHSDLSTHPRPLHKSWDGKVLSADDPWWQAHWPPNGWGCKCRAFSLSRSDLEAMGKSGPDEAPDDGVVAWIDKTTGERHDVPAGIDPGWDYAPGASRSSLAKAQIKAKIPATPPDLQPQLEAITSTVSPRQRAADAARRYVLENGLANATKSTEFAYAYDRNGAVLVQKKGKKSFVPFTDDEIKAMQAAEDVVLVHNHPSSYSLSDTDLFFADRIKGEVVAVGHNGTTYAVKILDGARLSLIKKIEAAMRRLVKPLINSGAVDVGHANDTYSHALNSILHGAGIIDYAVTDGVINLQPALADVVKKLGEKYR